MLDLPANFTIIDSADSEDIMDVLHKALKEYTRFREILQNTFQSP